MADSEPTVTRRARSAVLVAVVVAGAVLVGVAASHFLQGDPRSSLVAVGSGQPTTAGRGAQDDHDRRDRPDPPPLPLGEADGIVPDGVTVFDDDIPAVANLDPELLGALREAATDAEDDGVGFVVNSGWRSPEYQEQLRREAVLKYGSEEEAARWVATPETSLHVSGDAIDLGPAEATAWLSEHGAEYGLCQIYDNEPWHYELRPEAIDDGCPRRYADTTQDPRMQR